MRTLAMTRPRSLTGKTACMIRTYAGAGTASMTQNRAVTAIKAGQSPTTIKAGQSPTRPIKRNEPRLIAQATNAIRFRPKRGGKSNASQGATTKPRKGCAE